MNGMKIFVFRTTINILRNKAGPRIAPAFTKHIHTSASKSAAEEEKVKEESVSAQDILEDLKEPELTEEEIIQKRFKARLPERIYKMAILKQALPLQNKDDFKHYRLRRYWARFGSSSKLNPGLCWPTRDQILETIEYNKTFEPPLQEKIRRVEEKRLADLKQKQEYEAEVDQNMANLDKWIADYHARIQKKEDKIREMRLQREKLVEEISEYLGYDIDPKDPRFKEAVEQRDKEKKKALKVKKQQESYEKMLEKLKKIAQQKS